MKIVIAFYRTRLADDAQAVVGRESAEVDGVADAIGLARRLSRTLEMPQEPDAMSITNSQGRVLYSGAIEVWENDGGAAPAVVADPFYGRRVEADKSWTVYHVFTGEAARIGGEAMTGLSRSQATDRMMSLNHLNVVRRKERKATLRSRGVSVGAGSRP